VLIHRERRLLWLHNPKSAGMSVGRWLREMHGFEPAFPDLNAIVPETGVLCRHAWEPPAAYRSFERFVIVRHPVRRFESFYNFIRRIHARASLLTLPEFVATYGSWLPTQGTYVAAADHWFRVEDLARGLGEMGLGFGTDKIPSDNVTGHFVEWDADTLAAVVDRYLGDFRICGYRNPKIRYQISIDATGGVPID